MRNRPVAASMRKSIVSSVVLAGLTSLALLGRVESVSAATMTACQAKHMDCSARCIMSADSEGKGNACIERTCTHQFKSCAAVSGESKNPYHDYGPGLKPPKGTPPYTERPPRAPGGVSGGRGGGVGVGRPGGGRPGRDVSNVRDHRGPRGRGPRGSNPVELTSQSPAGQVRGPGWGGILDNVGGFGQQGPAATGSPMAPKAPSAPPVIIR